MKKYELTWFERQLVKQLRKRPMTVAEQIVKAAYDGYALRKIRKDAGVKKGEGENGR